MIVVQVSICILLIFILALHINSSNNLTIFSFIDIDDCRDNPCNNNGTCTDGIASYTCDCPLGFTGLDCETSMFNAKA